MIDTKCLQVQATDGTHAMCVHLPCAHPEFVLSTGTGEEGGGAWALD